MVKNLGLIGRPLMWLSNTRMLLMFGVPLAAFVIVAILVSTVTPGTQRPAAAPARAAASSMHRAIGRLADATAEYGAHLESHTGIVRGLAATTEQLRTAATDQRHASDALRSAVARQNRVLEGLDTVIGRLSSAVSAPGSNAAEPDVPATGGRTSKRRTPRAASASVPEEGDTGQRGAKAA